MKILAVGDLHLGYEEILNESGIFIGRKMFQEMIEYFDVLFEKIGKVDKIVLLGDVKHDFGKIYKQEWSDALGLFDYFYNHMNKKGEIVITKGNHDTIIEPIAKRANVKVVDFYAFEQYCFLHGDRDFKEIYDEKIKYWIIGHGHPAVKLSEGAKMESYKCFLSGNFKGREVIIMPSFFDYREGSDPRDSELKLAWDFDIEKFRVKVVGEDLSVLDFGILKNLP